MIAWINERSIERAGISCGGPLDSEKGIIISTPNLAHEWHGFGIVSYVKSRFGLNAKLENDANSRPRKRASPRKDITTKVIFERARNGEELYFSVVQESAEKFAKIVSILIGLFNPEVIIAGGVFMRNYDLFLPLITPIIEQESLTDSYKVCKILPAKIGENRGDYAALPIAVSEN